MTKKIDPATYTRLEKLPEYECGLADAVRFFKSKTALARALGLGKINPRTGQMVNGRQVVSEWFRRGAIPRQYVLPIHELTGVPLERLLKPFKPYRPTPKEIVEEIAAEIASEGQELEHQEQQEQAIEPAPVVPDVMDSLKKKPRKPRAKKIEA